jgi:hypothetical protein
MRFSGLKVARIGWPLTKSPRFNSFRASRPLPQLARSLLFVPFCGTQHDGTAAVAKNLSTSEAMRELCYYCFDGAAGLVAAGFDDF